MDPLNDLVWTDEDESDIMPAAIDGPPMPQICEIPARSNVLERFRSKCF